MSKMVEVKKTGERELEESTFDVYSLFVNNQKVYKNATQIKVLHECQGKDGGVVIVYYVKLAITIYMPTLYQQTGCRPIERRKGCGVQYFHELIVASFFDDKVTTETLACLTDSWKQPEEWALDTHTMAGAELVVTFANRYQPERSYSETFDLSNFLN